MASIKENNLELNYGWPYGESGWNSGMDENIVKLGFESRKRINGILSSPPSSPSNGDAYIVGTAPTGLFSGKFANIAIYDRNSWVFIIPKSQEVVFNVSNGCDYIYSNGWSLKLEEEISPYIKIKDFTFSTGYTITDQKQCLLNITDNHYYQWNGTFPKVVHAGSTPTTAGGIGVGLWSDKADLMVRSELSAIDGDSSTGYATYAQIRAYNGDKKSIRCGGRTSIYSGDGAHGKFYRDDSDTTSSDNDATVLVDALGRRWKRKYTGSVYGAWAGLGTNADDSTALSNIMRLAVSGLKVVLGKTGTQIKLSAPSVSTLVDNTTVDIDFGGAEIVPVSGYTLNTSDKLFCLNGGDTLLTNCKVTIRAPKIDTSSIVPVNATTLSDRRGIGGLLVQAAHTVNIENSTAKGHFYSASIFVNVFNTLVVNGHSGVDCGVKYNALVDDVSAGDAAGDAVYTANAIGHAQVSLRNVKSSSQESYIGRAGFVSESGDAASSITVAFDNVSFDGYQRITHQEDGGKSTIEWNGGWASRFSVMNFTLGATKKRGIKVKNVMAPDINPPFGYGGKSGVYAGDSQDQTVAPFASYEDCELGYSTAVEERYGAEYVRSKIILGPSVAITKIACNDRYLDCDVAFTNSAARMYYSNNSLPVISGGTSTCPTVNKTAWDLSGGALTIENGHQSKNCLPNVGGGTALSSYSGLFDIGDGSGVTGEIFIGSSHQREFVDVRIIAPTTGFIELKGNAGCVNKRMSNVQTEGVVINYDGHNTFSNRATTEGLIQRFGAGNTPSTPFQYSNSPSVVHIGYVLDRNNSFVTTPSSSGNVKYISSAVVNSDNTVTNIV